MKLVSKPILGTSALLMILNLAVDLLRSTNRFSVDFDKHSKLQNLTSSLRTKGTLFSSCIGAFRKALKRTAVRLPKGQCSHFKDKLLQVTL